MSSIADTPIHDPNVYGRSKLECERLLAELSRAHSGLRAVVDPAAGRRRSRIARQFSVRHDGPPRRRRDRRRSQSRCAVQQRRAYRRSCAFRRYACSARCRRDIGRQRSAPNDPLPIREVVAIMQAAAASQWRGALRARRPFIPDLERTCAHARLPAGDGARQRATFRQRASREA